MEYIMFNIFKNLGKLSYHAQQASTTIIQQPAKAVEDIKAGYIEAKQTENRQQSQPQSQQMELPL